MSTEEEKLRVLRQKINECLRVQRDTSETIPYVDGGNTVIDMCAKQNHVVFARRGCGKTLLLHHSGRSVDKAIRPIYLNCEEFKRHSFPNALIEILDRLFCELESNLGGWFGSKKRSKYLIKAIRADFSKLKQSEDIHEESVRDMTSFGNERSLKVSIGSSSSFVSANLGGAISKNSRTEVERNYMRINDKLRDLDIKLPHWKRQIEEFFRLSNSVNAVFIQLDDFYHLKRIDQPFIIDFIHRLCKDVPLYFKIATLRHVSSLYVECGQPIGVQQRHDYQPIDIDYTFADFSRTRTQNLRIFHEFGKMADLEPSQVDDLFKGEGFNRLVLAGGGVPRDTLSLFLEVFNNVQNTKDSRIGKDDVRVISRSNFERRIEEMKQDSEGGEQNELMRGIYALRNFCLTKKINAFVISEQVLQQEDAFKKVFLKRLCSPFWFISEVIGMSCGEQF